MVEPKVHTFESTFDYDALNRLSRIHYADGTEELYDMVSDPKRRASYDKAVEIARAHDLEVLVP